MGGNAIGIAAILGLVGLREVVGEARRVEAELVRRLAVVDRERFYLHEAASSMFAYMTERLGFAEGAAYKRIRVARLSLVVPAVLDALESGRVHLSGLHVLAPVLSPANADELLDWAAGKSKKLIEAHVDAMRRGSGEKQAAPRPRIRPVVIRRGEAKAAAGTGAATVPGPSLFEASAESPAKPAAEEPAAEEPAAEEPAARPDPVEVLFELSLTMTQGLREKWEKASGLMGRRGGASRVLEAALDLLIEQLEKERFGAPAAGKPKRPSKQQPKPQSTPEPEPQSKPKSKPARHIPNAIKRAVYDRDEGRCTFVDAEGHRCGSRVVELHHIEAFGRGGEHDVSNLTLHCPQHNMLEAEREYGEEAMKQYRRPA